MVEYEVFTTFSGFSFPQSLQPYIRNLPIYSQGKKGFQHGSNLFYGKARNGTESWTKPRNETLSCLQLTIAETALFIPGSHIYYINIESIVGSVVIGNEILMVGVAFSVIFISYT